ncbi:MAG: phage tail assembly chaperone, partial [Gemmataceae bacterium]|nr:phage tail assembly chaperone [Gemmataceae bacterium]
MPVFLLAQALGWTPDELHHLTPDEWAALVGEVEAFGSVERRRLFHLAYERRFREQTLDALTHHSSRKDEGGRMKDESEPETRFGPDSSFILHPSSFILHPSSFILHPSSFILHPSSFILHPSSFILHPSSFI